jgi:hypothetical protein
LDWRRPAGEPIDHPLERCCFLIMVRSQSRNCLDSIVDVRRLDRGLFHGASWKGGQLPSTCTVPNGALQAPSCYRELAAAAVSGASSRGCI